MIYDQTFEETMQIRPVTNGKKGKVNIIERRRNDDLMALTGAFQFSQNGVISSSASLLTLKDVNIEVIAYI